MRRGQMLLCRGHKQGCMCLSARGRKCTCNGICVCDLWAGCYAVLFGHMQAAYKKVACGLRVMVGGIAVCAWVCGAASNVGNCWHHHTPWWYWAGLKCHCIGDCCSITHPHQHLKAHRPSVPLRSITRVCLQLSAGASRV